MVQHGRWVAFTPFKTMGVAYYIVLEKEIDGLDTGMDGKKLSQQLECLDNVARELGVHPLSEFLSMDKDATIDVLGEDFADIDIPSAKQFSAQDGLATVRALIPRVEAQPALHDLKNC